MISTRRGPWLALRHQPVHDLPRGPRHDTDERLQPRRVHLDEQGIQLQDPTDRQLDDAQDAQRAVMDSWCLLQSMKLMEVLYGL
jgi:hypothetical protein